MMEKIVFDLACGFTYSWLFVMVIAAFAKRTKTPGVIDTPAALVHIPDKELFLYRFCSWRTEDNFYFVCREGSKWFVLELDEPANFNRCKKYRADTLTQAARIITKLQNDGYVKEWKK